MTVVDAAMAAIPRRVPEQSALERCRIISHRGEHDGNRQVKENTLAAFRAARDAGVWGIECDIRWSSDLVPVICHDPSPARVFGIDTPLAQMTFSDIRANLPDIPSLEDVIAEFGGNTHLMLEIKAEPRPDMARQVDILQAGLAPLSPRADYHILALEPETFDLVPFLGPDCWLPVAELNVSTLSRFALDKGCAGLGGHYLLLGPGIQAQHDSQAQQLGVGFPTSRNALFRELNRGVEWIFSNDAVKLQHILDQHLEGETHVR